MARAIFWGEVKDDNSLVTNSLVHEFLGHATFTSSQST
jgi:hypothetical protein